MSIFGRKHRLMNVCPKITNEALWRRAGVTPRRFEQPSRQAFALELPYDAYKEVVWLEPSQVSEPLEPEVAQALAKQHADQGVILIEENEPLEPQVERGLEVAIGFFNLRGDQEMVQFEVSLNEQQRRLMSEALRGIRINQERERVLREHLDGLRGGVAASPPPTVSQWLSPVVEVAQEKFITTQEKREAKKVPMPCGKRIDSRGRYLHERKCKACKALQVEANAPSAA